ncbi:hypothetical protein ACHAXA_002218 [Cyclostephanos tholiformis]|uniref:Uncharacterized protein n=1 Tax=Cyclostephanos tholiformis TaxID=382380 RepID=A0ABD3RWX7_9STRA
MATASGGGGPASIDETTIILTNLILYSSTIVGTASPTPADVAARGRMIDPHLDPTSPPPPHPSIAPPSSPPPNPSPLHLLLVLDEDDKSSSSSSSSMMIRRNFNRMSILFAINHGCSVSVLGLANARLGNAGVWSSGVLYACYTMSALFGTTSVIASRWGCRDGLVLGMGTSAAYVVGFYLSSIFAPLSGDELDDGDDCKVWLRYVISIAGAMVGGVGSSVLWVSQGAYFATSSRLYASANTRTTATAEDGRQHPRGADGEAGAAATSSLEEEDATSEFGAAFAFVFLLFEVMLRSLSTFLIRTVGLSWRVVLGLYALLSILSAVSMMYVADPEERCRDDRHDRARRTDNGASSDDDHVYVNVDDDDDGGDAVVDHHQPPLKAAAALDILRGDTKAKYLAPVCVLFGLSTSFALSILNGEVIQRVLSDPDSTYVGLYTAMTSLVAAGASLIFGMLQSSSSRGGRSRCEKDAVLTIGASSYLLISLLFLSPLDWDRATLLLIYTLLGVGRATYEGTLRAVFADYFPNDKEGAFGCIILFTGTASTVGYVLSATRALECDSVGRYCLKYSDGTIHNVLVMECVTIATAVIAIPSIWRADWLFRNDGIM